MKIVPGLLKSSITRYPLSIGMVVVALLLYQALVKLVGGPLPTYITFYPAVIIAGLFAGSGASLLATVTTALLASYWILPPEGFAISSLPDVVGQVIFLFNGGLISVVIEIYRRSERRAADYATELAIRDERNKAEEALRESEEMKWEILESISDAFFSLDDNMVVNYFSPSAERILNRKTGEVIGRLWFDAFPEAQGSIFEENYAQCIRTKTALSFEARLDIAPYEDWYEVRVYPRNNGIVVFFQVITERKQAEEQIRMLNERLEQQVAKLEDANKNLESFSYSISHDLRTPLRAIDGFTRKISEKYNDTLDEEGKRLLNIVRKNTKIMSELIKGILDLSHIGRQRVNLSDVDMNNLVREVYDDLISLVPEGKINFVMKTSPPARADKLLLHQVFANLLSNAIKFTAPQGDALIEFGGSDEEQKNVYYVKDNGVGFDMTYADKLYGIFQRLHSADEYEGTGIGLAIVQRIVLMHGGSVWAEGKVGGGATFYFSLPK